MRAMLLTKGNVYFNVTTKYELHIENDVSDEYEIAGILGFLIIYFNNHTALSRVGRAFIMRSRADG